MKRFIAFSLLLVILLLAPQAVRADAPYRTWTLGPNERYVMTQAAYLPADEIDVPVSGAEDLVIADDGTVYIADTGNARIVRLNSQFEEEASYGEGVLKGPTGLFVSEDGTMYVADAAANSIVIIGADGEVINQFGRPEEPLFGRNRQFLPRKIAVDARQNLYVISEGSVNGVVQMNTKGNFIGYFGANSASLSLPLLLRRFFLSDEQLDQFVRNEAASPSNLTIDHQSLLFTVTAGSRGSQPIRRFTVAGRNIFPEAPGYSDFRDIDVSDEGLVVAVSGNGYIVEYDLNGTMLFDFGALDTGEQRLGLLRNPTAIARHGERLYVLDKDKNALVVYETTAFGQQVHQGVRLYMEGLYTEAKPYFEGVLDYNGSFIMAYQAIADSDFKEMNYQTALDNYRFAEDRSGYSQAYWELRNVRLQRWLGTALMAMAGLAVFSSVGGRLDRRYGWTQPLRRWWDRVKSIKLVDDFLFMFRFIKQPIDSFYYIKKNMRGSLRFAALIYLAVVAVRVLLLYVTGFVFNPYSAFSQIPVVNVIVFTVVLLALWNAANYLVATISDGEGSLRHVVIGTAYSLFPYLLIAMPMALLSNVLTENEAFLYQFPHTLMWLWIGIMLFFMVREIHNYSFSETVKNILVTIFTMAMAVLTAYILYVLFQQLYEFISAIIRELRLRA